MKNYIYYIAILLLLTPSLQGQILDLEWAKSYGGNNNDNFRSFTLDKFSNIFSVGLFQDTVDFDPGKNISNLVSDGETDIFIQKVDKNGNFIWVKSIHSKHRLNASQIQSDSSQNIYITGTFQDTVDFDPGQGVYERTTDGKTNSFLLKLDKNGEFLWVKTFGGSASNFFLAESNNFYIVGSYVDTIDVDPGMKEYNIISNGRADFFVLKLNSTGDFQWAKSIGGPSFDNCTDIIYDDGNIYLSGTFRDRIDFDPNPNQSYFEGVFGSTKSTIFLLKLDSIGNFIFVETLGGNKNFQNGHLHMDSSGDLYLGGYYQETADFDFSSNEFLLTSNGSLDIFVQKINNNGQLIWAKSIGGPGAEFLHYITTDKSDNVYIAGQFSMESDFNPSTSTHTKISNGKNDGFIEKLDADGNFIWVAQQGGINNDAYSSIKLDKYENIYCASYFNDTSDVDPSSIKLNFKSNGKSDILIQKFKQCHDNQGIDSVVACKKHTWIDGITYTVNNSTSTFTLKNIGGCDSLVTLNLIINAPTSSIETIEACHSYTWTNGITYTTNNNVAKDTFLNIKGCDSIINLDLTINNVNVEIDSKDNVVTAKEPNLIYQWLDCDQNFSAIQGETSQSFTPTHNGNYAVEITKSSCVDTSICVEIMSVSTFDDSDYNKITITPNPSYDQFVINFGDININEAQIRMFDMGGKELMKTNKMSGQKNVTIDVKNLQDGLHLIKIQYDAIETIYKKVIINK